MATSRKSTNPEAPEQMGFNFSAEEPLVSHSPWLDCARAWMIRAVTWPSNIWHWLTDSGPAGWYGKTSPESYRQPAMARPIHVRRRTQWIWDSTDRKWKLKKSTIQKNYTPSTASWPDFQASGMGSHIEFLTLNTSAWPSDGAACSLSDILEVGSVPRRYFLSPRACLGILRRAAKRLHKLPHQLHLALAGVANRLADGKRMM